MKLLINLKVFAYFRLINHIKQDKHRHRLTYQDPSFQWLEVLLVGVEKWRITLEFFVCFCEETFTRILAFRFVYAWAIFRQTIAPEVSELSEKMNTLDYFYDKVKFLRKFSFSAIF